MKTRPITLVIALFTALTFLLKNGVSAATIVQKAGDSYVAFEADTLPALTAGTPETWVSTNEPTASGGTALYAAGNNETGTSPHSFAQYSIKFATAGTYYLYVRWKADTARTAGDAFTANSFQIANQFGAFSTPGDVSPFHISGSNAGSAPSDNVFDWTREPDTSVYTVSAGDLTNPLIFTIGTREAGMTIDRLVFSTEAALTDAQLDALINSDIDQVIQKPGDTFAAFEADGAKAKIIAGTPETWVSTNEPTASGGTALYAAGNNETGTSPHSFAQYSIRFATAGTYYLYVRWKADSARTAGDAFTANSFQIANQFGAYSTPGDVTPFHISGSNAGSAPSDNVFDWTREPDTSVYTISQADVDARAPVIFTVGTREAGMTVDRFVFSTDPALTDAQLDALPNSGATVVAPEIVRAVGSAGLNSVTIFFTRPLLGSSVSPARFTPSGNVTVNSAAVDPDDARIVHLTTSPQTAGTVYSVGVAGVTDTGGTAIAANASVNFTAWKIVPGWALKEIFFGIPGAGVADVTADPDFPARPDRVEWVKGFQLNDDPLTDNYGARLTAFFTPQASGVYTFFVNNDDEAELLLSSDASEANLQSLGVFALSPRAFSDASSANSPGSLTSGQRYFLEGILKQNSGPVYLNVAAKLASDGTPATDLSVLSGNQIGSWVNPDLGNVTFTQGPSNAIVPIGGRATFTVKARATESPVYYQWRLNGTGIPGAVRATYTTPVLAGGESGRVYSVAVSVAGKETISGDALLTVVSGEGGPVQPYLGINFVGGGTFGGASLAPAEVAGVVQQENWNNLEGFTFADVPLKDAAGAATPVTLNGEATEVWYTGTLAANSPDGALLQGFINSVASTDPVTFTLNNVPAGNYHLLAYSTGFDFSANYFQGYSVTGAGTYPAYHGKAETGLNFVGNPGFRRITNQTAGVTNVGNYVQFDNVSPAADGTLTLTVTWEPPDPAVNNSHQPAINALQLARVSAVTARPTLTATAGNGNLTIAWTASAAGFVLETSPTLGSGATWTPVSGAANPLAGAGSVSVNTSGNSAFYRLRK